jgi:tetratricopeptide (TPR) repeat protein
MQGKTEASLFYAEGICKEWQRSKALAIISSELKKQGKETAAEKMMQEALYFASGIDKWGKSRVLPSISSELTKQGKTEEATKVMEEALICAVGINDAYLKSSALVILSTELAKQGKTEEALSSALGIIDESERAKALAIISSEMIKQSEKVKGKKVMEDALHYAAGISDQAEKSRALVSISIELAKQGNWQKAEEISLKISSTGKRHQCWKYITKAHLEKHGWKNSLVYFSKLYHKEAFLFYLKGWVEWIKITDVNEICICEALPIFLKNSVIIEALLQKFAIVEISLRNPSEEFLQRLNKTLNIQWVIDIRNRINELNN